MLIEPGQGTAIPGLQIPKQLYWVTQSPAPFAGMKLPDQGWPWAALHAAGFRDVVSLHPASDDPAPLSRVFAEHLEDLCHGRPPGHPDLELALIRKAVQVTPSSLTSARGVLVHCWGGRGRTGTVIGCVLRELGYDGETSVAYLDRVHKARGKSGWPESEWQADLVRHWTTDA